MATERESSEPEASEPAASQLEAPEATEPAASELEAPASSEPAASALEATALEATERAPQRTVASVAASGPAAAAGRGPLLALIIALALPGALSALWLAPRPAEPAEMPPLVVPQVRAQASIASLTALAGQAPGDDDVTEARRRELYLLHGVSEARPDAAPAQARTRDEELQALAVTLETQGHLDAVRASDVLRTIEALSRGGQDADRLGEIGAFPRLLEQWGAVLQGRRIAPRLVIHALAVARWNGIHGRELTEGMDETLLLAYHGWLAFYGPSGGTDLRGGALVEYVRAGGRRGLETEAFLRLSGGDAAGAQLAFEAAYQASGNVRLRNHALALGLSSLEPDEARPAEPGS